MMPSGEKHQRHHRSPKDKERKAEQSALRIQEFNRKKSLAAYGIDPSEAEFLTPFSSSLDEPPSRSPSPGRIAPLIPPATGGGQKNLWEVRQLPLKPPAPMAPPAATTLSQMQAARPTKRARGILRKALIGSQ